MNEASRFLRYILPGLGVLIEASIFMAIYDTAELHRIIKFAGETIANPIIIITGAAGLGYFLAFIYYVILDYSLFEEYLSIDHSDFVRNSINNTPPGLTLNNQATNNPLSADEITRISRNGAWRIVVSLWQANKNVTPIIEGADNRQERASDLLHGHGTALIGSFFSLLIWVILLVILRQKTQGNPDLLVALKPGKILWILFAFGVIIFFRIINYRKIVNDTKTMGELILVQAISSKNPILLRVNLQDVTTSPSLWVTIPVTVISLLVIALFIVMLFSYWP